MYRFLQYEHILKDKLLARNIKSNKDRYIVDNELIYHLWNKRLNRHIYKHLCIHMELRPKILSLLHDTRECTKCLRKQFDIYGGIIYTKTCKTMCQVVSYAW